MTRITAIVDLQFGSTGKGLLAGYLAQTQSPDVIVTAWGPNAGHTFIDADGRKFVNIALPNGIVAKPEFILLGPGSVIDPTQLLKEMELYADLLQGTNILIHEHASIVTEADRQAEQQYGFKIGSTMKGVGEAVIKKIRRLPPLNVAKHALPHTVLSSHVVGRESYNRIIDGARDILIEGAQGYSLGINSGFYPHTTSRECTAAQLQVDCAIPFDLASEMTVYGVARTYPIRVANRFDAKGNMVGTSGPCYPDQRELMWGELGREPELTTVTKLPRRIFTWSNTQISEAIRANGCDGVFLNFVNYMPQDATLPEGQPSLGDIMQSVKDAGSHVHWVGQGPTVNDVITVM